jgi:hypothetical protein
MKPETSAALVGLVLGMAATADAKTAAGDATCRNVNNGAVSRVCRWPVGQGNTVDVYYGEPSKRAPAPPVPPQPSYPPPPAYYEPAAYYDDGYGYGYGYGWGYPYLPFITDSRVRGHHLGPDLRLGNFHHGLGPRIGFRGGSHGGFHGGFQGVEFRGGAGGGRH